MRSRNVRATTAGLLFITATAASLIATALLGSFLDGSGFLATVALHQDRLLTAALFQLLAAFTSAAIAVTLYPVLREHAAGTALGAVAFRLIEGVFYALSAVGTLILVSLAEQLTASPSANASADLVRDLRDSASCVGVLAFYTGATLYYLVFYRSQLIPRWLSVWGLAGTILGLVSGLLVLFQSIAVLSGTQVVLNLPIGVQEMVLAVWLIVKGFSPKLQPTAPKPRAEALHPVWTSQHQLASRAAESRATLPATSTAPLIAIDNVGASDRAPADGPSRRFPSRVPLRATGACPPRCPRTATNNQRSPPATCEHEASVPSLHDCLGRVRRVKAKPLCGRFASLDTPHTARGMGTYRGDGGKVAHGGRRSGWQFNAVPRQYEAASQGMSVQPELIRTVTIRAANAVDRTAQKYSNVPEQPPAAPSGSTLSLLGRRPNAQQRR